MTTLAALVQGSIDKSEADMDTMIQAASVPNLASLFQAGKDAGLIKPTTMYGGKPTTAP